MNYLKRIALILAGLYIFSSVIIYMLVKNFYENEALKRIRQTVHYETALQHYVSTYQKPVIYRLLHDAKLPLEYFDPVLLSSSFVAKSIHESYLDIVKKEHNTDPQVVLKFASDNPTNPANLTNDYEQRILEDFRQGKETEFIDKIMKDGKEYIFYAKPYAPNGPKCLQCHSNPAIAPKGMIEKYGSKNGFGERVGHIRAMTALYTPVGIDNSHAMFIFFSLEVLSLFVFGMIFFIIYHYTKKLSNKDKFIAQQSKFAAMGEMVGMIAHQWRQPLTGIGMTIDNLKLDIELQTVDETKWMSNLDQMSGQIHYLSHTIDDFRNFFKPNQQPQSITLATFIPETLQVINSSLRKHNMDITIECDEDLTLSSYRNDLMQVLLNLVKNAQDAYVEHEITPRPLHISVRGDTRSVSLHITDHAGGIPSEIIEKIFDPYFSTKSEKNGTGLGLYMSKLIVQDHLGGKLTAHSSDGSTTLELTLPNINVKEN